MSAQVTLTLPDPLYRRAQQIAQQTQRDITEVLTEVLMQTIQPFPVHEKQAEMMEEIEAYKALHPQLVTQYLGQYVAIYQGKMVDYDANPVDLLIRIRANYPAQVVLRRKVEKQPETVLQFRSPRFIQTL